MNIEIYPLEKVVIDGVPVFLGMERTAVEAAIGSGELVRKRSYYHDGEMAIDYSHDGKVEFIEFLGGVDGTLRPSMDGVSVFDAPADEVAALLKEKNNGQLHEAEGEYSYAYRNISIGVYRETTPADVMEMIEQMKADGICVENSEAVREEQRKANHWATIGVGAEGYYRR